MPSRRAKPYFAVHVIANLQGNKLHKGRVHQLEQQLAKIINKKIDKDKASKIIENLIKDGVIIADSKDNGLLRIPNDSEIQTYNQDLYCYECFLPGELVKCRDCSRAFHVNCARRHPERPNYVIPKSNQIAEYNDDEQIENNSNTLRSSTPVVHSTAGNVKVKRCRVLVERSRLISVNDANEPTDVCCDLKPEVVCLGELRPPTRQRNVTESSSTSMKHESETDIVEAEKEFCTFCRLIKGGQTLQPPNLDATEMCHLLKYTFKRNRAWIKHDIYKQLDNTYKLTKKSIALLIRILFPNRRVMTLEAIDEKIKYNQYKLLNELLADFVEFQYAIGVLFGSDHVDFDTSKYMVRDIQYDIQEIRRCPDCFRHSSDRITPYWFALPCVQRHELVLAKCKGHAFWPAKVVRVLHRADKYDVRFFGGNHERALVDKNYIRPIDATDIVKPKSILFKKAMNELLCYQALEVYSLEKFSFHSANKDEINEIIQTVMSAIDGAFKMGTAGVGKRIDKRRKTIAGSNINNVDMQARFSAFLFEENSTNFEGGGSSSEPRTPTPSKRREPANKAATMPTKRIRYESPQVDVPTSTTSSITAAVADGDASVDEILMLRKENESLKLELMIAKRKSYCFVCLEPAEFICCINASYCSKKCQRQHWVNGHQISCSHRH